MLNIENARKMFNTMTFYDALCIHIVDKGFTRADINQCAASFECSYEDAVYYIWIEYCDED